MRPLEGILVLEFSQFMAGPSAGLRMADLGARVIKIERPKSGEGGRQIAIKNLFVDGSSLVFQTVNRNKESFAANLKDKEDLDSVKKLINRADVITHNFRPGVMEKIGLDYESVKQLNPKVVYATVTGYGTEGPWAKKPGQDLLVQCMSGLAYLTGNQNDGPVPMGLAVADIVTGTHLVQGVIAALIKRHKTGKGALVELSLLESILDFQFEVITTYLNDGGQLPKRAKKNSAHAYLSAPYGIYKTSDGHIAIAMGSLVKLGEAIKSNALIHYTDPKSWFEHRHAIMDLLIDIFAQESTAHWLALLESKNIWCSDVFDYETLLNHEGYRIMEMDQKLLLESGDQVHTTRCPIQIDDKKLLASKPAPRVGQHNEAITKEFGL